MIRIQGGEFRGRVIRAPHGHSTRPTQAKLRSALFNSLQTVITGSTVLELFAGSGSLGFEALSWGAEKVDFVEDSRPVVKLLHENAASLKVESKIRVFPLPVDDFARKPGIKGPYDLVLADPPYHQGWELKLLGLFPWIELLNPEGRFCLEWSPDKKGGLQSLPEQAPGIEKIREKAYGDTTITTYRRTDRLLESEV